MKDIIESFVVEVAEHIENLDRSLVELEENPSDFDLLNKIFRAAHTIKGAASFLDFDVMAKVTHHAESVLDDLRKNKLTVNSEIMDVILQAVDEVKSIFQEIKETYQENKSRDILPIVTKLENIHKGISPDAAEPPKKAEGKPVPVPPPVQETVSQQTEIEPPAPKPALKESEIQETEISSGSADTKDSRKPPLPADKKSVEQLQTIRVDLQRLDDVMNLVQELVPGRNRLLQVNKVFKEKIVETHRQFEELYQKVSVDHKKMHTTQDDKKARKKFSDEITVMSEMYDEITAQIDLITTELQLAVMKTRMLPIGNVFNRFPRMVRDLTREVNKDIRLEIEGKDTELDKSVIEIIGDPLIHCIRNSIDHAIEKPDERERKGKPRQGIIGLAAFHEGNYIVVQVIDDGKGLDLERIKKKAVEKGLFTADEIKSMSEKDLCNIIFMPGFSTAENVTNVSGRGVGMDVLKTNIERLNGLIDVDTVENEGTTITIKIPLTLAIIQALLVRVGQEIYAIPLVSVVETVRILKSEIKTVKNHQVYRLRDSILPLMSLAEVFDLEGDPRTEINYIYVVVLGIAERRIGLVVDNLLGQEEVVIKSLGDFFDDTPGIAGATIMGDGRVRLIVNVSDLVDISENKK
ncbi:MAG: chemotaxis protein CheA [Candidatus Delongbacteria bacterium]|nr:chemotaxis protein CheA [Candidatus Delongbacteria bacterium]